MYLSLSLSNKQIMNNRIIISIAIFLFLGVLWYTITPKKSVLYADESPYGRDAYRSEMRAHSATPQKIEAAKSMIASSIEKRKNYKDGGLSTWEELGPGQYAGRTRAIAVDPRNTNTCLLYTSPSPRDATLSRMPSSA